MWNIFDLQKDFGTVDHEILLTKRNIMVFAVSQMIDLNLISLIGNSMFL